MTSNLGLLAVFKYLDFGLRNLNRALALTGLEAEIPLPHLVLPVGISFYTFQSMSYTIYVYRGAHGVEPSCSRFALYVVFFPQLVAGWMRGSHYGAWYPCGVDQSDPTYHDGPPRVCAIGIQISNGRIQDAEQPGSKPGDHKPIDYFAGKEWDSVREKAMEISIYMRGGGSFGRFE